MFKKLERLFLLLLVAVLLPLVEASSGLPKEVFCNMKFEASAPEDPSAPRWEDMTPGVIYAYLTAANGTFAARMQVEKVRNQNLEDIPMEGRAIATSRVFIEGPTIGIVNQGTKIEIDEAAIFGNLPKQGSGLYGGGTLSQLDFKSLFQFRKELTMRHEKLHEIDNWVYPESTLKSRTYSVSQLGFEQSKLTAMATQAGVPASTLNRLYDMERQMDILAEARAVREEMAYTYDYLYGNMIFADTWPYWEVVSGMSPVSAGLDERGLALTREVAAQIAPGVAVEGIPMNYGELFKLISVQGKDSAREMLSKLIIDSRLALAHVRISGMDVTYEEAYNKYFEDFPSLHTWSQEELFGHTDAIMAHLASEYRKLLQDVWSQIYNHLKRTNPERVNRIASSQSQSPQPKKSSGRKVCFPCRVRDTLGRCSRRECCNYGRPHTQYQKQEGDKAL